MVNYDNALKPGTVLQGVEHSYRIKQVLGQGSFGITYLAYTSVSVCGQLGKVKTEIPVAIKEFFMHDVNGREGTMVTLGSKGGLFGDYRRKFTHEARNLGRLQHPGIVQVIEIFEANGTSYFSMEYCEGGSLDARIARQGCIRESEAIRLFGQIASALTYMHSQGMLHLDVKPGNIMLRGDGEAVLIDFGLSKQYDENGEPESSTTIRCGTPRYAPFEQVNYQERKGKFPVTMDVYALGATLYKMLTGEVPPFPAELLDGFPEQSLRSHGISDHTIACIRRAMSPRVADRYQSVPDFAAALQDDATVVEDKYGSEDVRIKLETFKTIMSEQKDIKLKKRKSISLFAIVVAVVAIIVVSILLKPNLVDSMHNDAVTSDSISVLTDTVLPNDDENKQEDMFITSESNADTQLQITEHSSEHIGLEAPTSNIGKEQKRIRHDISGWAASEGLITLPNDDYSCWGFVDEDGYEVIPFKYEWAYGFSDGLAMVKLNGEWGFIDKKDNVIIPFQFENECGEFHEGMAAICKNGKIGFINKKGVEVIPCIYDCPPYSDLKKDIFFSEGLARVMLNDKWGFINKNGDEVIPFKYEWAYGFSDGLAVVELNGKKGYIDKGGNIAIDCIYYRAYPFSDGKAEVMLHYGEDSFYIDKKGNRIY